MTTFKVVSEIQVYNSFTILENNFEVIFPFVSKIKTISNIRFNLVMGLKRFQN